MKKYLAAAFFLAALAVTASAAAPEDSLISLRYWKETLFPQAVQAGEEAADQLLQKTYDAALAELNAITHPHVTRAVRELLREAEGQGKPAAAIDAIGLFESGLDRLCDTTLAVTAPPETRIRRIMAREGISEEYARARVSAQNPDEFYTARCGYTLINDCAGPREFAGRARALFLRILPQSP